MTNIVPGILASHYVVDIRQFLKSSPQALAATGRYMHVLFSRIFPATLFIHTHYRPGTTRLQ